MKRSTKSPQKLTAPRHTVSSLKSNLEALASFLGSEISDLNRKVDNIATDAISKDITNLFDQVHSVDEKVNRVPQTIFNLIKIMQEVRGRVDRLEKTMAQTALNLEKRIESLQKDSWQRVVEVSNKVNALERACGFGGPVENGLVQRIDRLTALVEENDGSLRRFVDHVNREIGVAQDVPLHSYVESLHKRIALLTEKACAEDKQPVDPGYDQKDESPDQSPIPGYVPCGCSVPVNHEVPSQCRWNPEKTQQPAYFDSVLDSDHLKQQAAQVKRPVVTGNWNAYLGADWTFKDKVLFTHFFRLYPIKLPPAEHFEVMPGGGDVVRKVPATTPLEQVEEKMKFTYPVIRINGPITGLDDNIVQKSGNGFHTWTVVLRRVNPDLSDPSELVNLEITKTIVARDIFEALEKRHLQYPELSGTYRVVSVSQEEK